MKELNLQILKYLLLCIFVIFISSCSSIKGGFNEEISTLNFGEVLKLEVKDVLWFDNAIKIYVPRDIVEIEFDYGDGLNRTRKLKKGEHEFRIMRNSKFVFIKIVFPPGNTYIEYQKGYLSSFIGP